MRWRYLTLTMLVNFPTDEIWFANIMKSIYVQTWALWFVLYASIGSLILASFDLTLLDFGDLPSLAPWQFLYEDAHSHTCARIWGWVAIGWNNIVQLCRLCIPTFKIPVLHSFHNTCTRQFLAQPSIPTATVYNTLDMAFALLIWLYYFISNDAIRN